MALGSFNHASWKSLNVKLCFRLSLHERHKNATSFIPSWSAAVSLWFVMYLYRFSLHNNIICHLIPTSAFTQHKVVLMFINNSSFWSGRCIFFDPWFFLQKNLLICIISRKFSLQLINFHHIARIFMVVVNQLNNSINCQSKHYCTYDLIDTMIS